MKTLGVLAILLSLVSASPAKVLIYKGTFVSKTGPVRIRPSSGKFFMIFNPDSQQIASVTFLSDGKKVWDTGPATDIQVALAEIPQGRSATTISLNTSGVSELPSFTNGIFNLRGTNATLKVASTGLVTSNQPRILNGINIPTGIAQEIGIFVEQRFALTYQEQRSLRANDANQSISRVAEDLGKELTLKGFGD